MKTNAQNERVKRRYLAHIREVRQLDEKTVDAVAGALERFEIYTRRREFREHRPEQAVAFKRHLAEQRNARTGDRLSKSTILATLTALRHFFEWLSGQRGYRSRLNRDDADYFKASLKDVAVATAPRQKRVPTLEEIAMAVGAAPSSSSVELRDQALLAFTIVTGARDDATASFQIKHLDLARRVLLQDGKVVRTKFAKTFVSWFFPVGHGFEDILARWKAHLEELGYGPSDPLFPATKIGVDADGNFTAVGLDRKGWASADPVRAAFRAAFERVGLPYSNPHLFRDTLMGLGYRLCETPEELKAWSQNLGHDRMMTSIASYGQLSAERQREIIENLGRTPDEDEKALKLGREMLKTIKRVV